MQGLCRKCWILKIFDEIITVENDDAFQAARANRALGGVFGRHFFRSGCMGSNTAGQTTENEGKTIVALLADTGERYLSTPMFEA